MLCPQKGGCLIAGRDAHGTQFKRDSDGAGSFELVANVSEITGPERERNMTDVTAHDSPDKYMEFVKGLKDGGEITVTINYDPAQSTHESLDSDYEEDDMRDYQIVILPDSEDEHTWDATCGISAISDSYPVDDRAEREVTLKVSGKPTLTHTGSS